MNSEIKDVLQQYVTLNDNDLLQMRRLKLGLSQQAVADKADIPLQSYQQFESGKRSIRRASFQIACQVLEALDIDFTRFHRHEYSILEMDAHSFPPETINKGKKFLDKLLNTPIDEI